MENIYFLARRISGLSQERWAEMLGVSTEAVSLYERGLNQPSDRVVSRMAEIAVLPPLCYWHLRQKSEIAKRELPPVDRLPLAQAVVQLLDAIRAFTAAHGEEDLIRIAADGRVDPEEQERFKRIVRDLDGIVRASLQINYAEEVTP